MMTKFIGTSVKKTVSKYPVISLINFKIMLGETLMKTIM